MPISFFDRVISTGIARLLDPFINPGGGLIILVQEIIDDLIKRDPRMLLLARYSGTGVTPKVSVNL